MVILARIEWPEYFTAGVKGKKEKTASFYK
jgi:hypothetical protein